MNIYIDLSSDPKKTRAKILPFDFLSSKSDLDFNDLPKQFLLSPELVNLVSSSSAANKVNKQTINDF